jgi:phage gpG-like protein
MEAITIKFNFVGIDMMVRSLNNLEGAMNDFTDALNECADDFYRVAEEAFETEGRSLGNPWRPLTQASLATKSGRYGNKGILERTGALKNSLTNRNDPNAVCVVEPMRLTIGSDVKTEGDAQISLLKLHQYGWNKPEIVPTHAKALRWGSDENPVFSLKSRATRVDARPVFLMTGDTKERWMRIFQTDMMEKLEESGARPQTYRPIPTE